MATALPASYDWLLVVCSVAIASLAAYAQEQVERAKSVFDTAVSTAASASTQWRTTELDVGNELLSR